MENEEEDDLPASNIEEALEKAKDSRKESKINPAIFAAFFTGELKSTLEALRNAGFKCGQTTYYRYKASPEFSDAIRQRIQQSAGVLDMDALRLLWSGWATSSENDNLKAKASEMLAKSQGGFIERVEHSGNLALSIADLLARKQPKPESDGK